MEVSCWYLWCSRRQWSIVDEGGCSSDDRSSIRLVIKGCIETVATPIFCCLWCNDVGLHAIDEAGLKLKICTVRGIVLHKIGSFCGKGFSQGGTFGERGSANWGACGQILYVACLYNSHFLEENIGGIALSYFAGTDLPSTPFSFLTDYTSPPRTIKI